MKKSFGKTPVETAFVNLVYSIAYAQIREEKSSQRQAADKSEYEKISEEVSQKKCEDEIHYLNNSRSHKKKKYLNGFSIFK